MQLLLSHRWACLITIAMVIASIMYFDPLLNAMYMLTIAGVWCRELIKAKQNKNEVINIVKRGHQLKNFSIEFQQMVNTELGLVQEDVIRIRSVVSDSIMILQNSTNSITEAVELFIKQDENLQRTQKNLESAAKQVTDTETIINSVHSFSEKIHLLSTNLALEAKQASNDITSINEPLHTCSEISRQSGQLQKELSSRSQLINSIITEVNHLSAQSTIIASSQSFKDNIRENTGNIIRALQFEDIICQMSERAASHIGDIRILVDQLSHLYENELSTNFENDLKEARRNLDEIKEKLAKESAKVVVSQENMDEGDIELF